MSSFLAGFLTGISTRVLVQPFDVIKIRIQLQNEPLSKNAYYSSIPNCFSRIIREEGMRSLFSGLVPAQLLAAVYMGTQFLTFESLQLISDNKLANGFIAGSVAVVASQPLDLIRTRIIGQRNSRIYKGTFDAVFKIIQQERFLSLWKGTWPCLISTAPQNAVNFYIYHEINDRVKSYKISYSSVLSGAISGLISKTLIYPLDLVRKRFEVVGFERHCQNHGVLPKRFIKYSYVNFKDALYNRCATFRILKHIYCNHGVSGMYQGCLIAMTKSTVYSSLAFTIYEAFMEILGPPPNLKSSQ